MPTLIRNLASLFPPLFLFGRTRIVFIPRIGVRFREGWCGAGTCGCEGGAATRTWLPSPSPPPVLLPSHYIKQWGDGYRFQWRRLITSHPRNMAGSQYRQQRNEFFYGTPWKTSEKYQWLSIKRRNPKYHSTQNSRSHSSKPIRFQFEHYLQARYLIAVRRQCYFSLDQSTCNVF